jgi:hypothetical protein
MNDTFFFIPLDFEQKKDPPVRQVFYVCSFN